MADWSTLAGAVVGGSLLPKMFGVIKRWMGGSTVAEARKINAEADNLIIENLKSEVLRLSAEVENLRHDFQLARLAADDEKSRLVKENRLLSGKVTKLTLRVEGLEDIFKLPHTPDDMLEALANLNKIEGSDK